MNITDYQRSTTQIIIGTATNSLAFGGVTISSNAAGANGSVLVATSSNSAIWRDAIAFGSNATDVSSLTTGGASSSNSRADHTHRGVSSLSHTSNTLYGGITLTTPGNSIGITSPTPGTLALTAQPTGGGSSSTWQVHAYTEKTSNTNITATTEAGANTIVTASAVFLDGAESVTVEFFSPEVTLPNEPANNNLVLYLFDDAGSGAASLGVFAVFLLNNSQSQRTPTTLRRRLTPSSGSHTYSVRGAVGQGTGQVSGGVGGAGARVPAYIKITTG